MFTLIKTKVLKDLESKNMDLLSMLENANYELFNERRRVTELEAQLLHAENTVRIAKELLIERNQNA